MNNKIILTLFISFIMISSVIGFVWTSSSDTVTYETIEYQNYNFNKINDKYILELNGNEYVFDNTPYELSDIDASNVIIESSKYYILFDPEDKDLNLEYSIQKLYLVLNSLGVNVQLACSKEEGCDSTLPIKTCDDYSFYFKKSINAKIYKENRCVVIEGSNLDISKEVDKINLFLLKVI